MVASAVPSGAHTATSPHRFKIYFEDARVRQRSEQAMHQLLSAALDKSPSPTNSTLLAKKALKYRKVLERAADVDVDSPEFDASKFMGVDWCHTPCLKAHCARLQ